MINKINLHANSLIIYKKGTGLNSEASERFLSFMLHCNERAVPFGTALIVASTDYSADEMNDKAFLSP